MKKPKPIWVLWDCVIGFSGYIFHSQHSAVEYTKASSIPYTPVKYVPVLPKPKKKGPRQ